MGFEPGPTDSKSHGSVIKPESLANISYVTSFIIFTGYSFYVVLSFGTILRTKQNTTRRYTAGNKIMECQMRFWKEGSNFSGSNFVWVLVRPC